MLDSLGLLSYLTWLLRSLALVPRAQTLYFSLCTHNIVISSSLMALSTIYWIPPDLHL